MVVATDPARMLHDSICMQLLHGSMPGGCVDIKWD
jgi:hypothetical protein